MTLLRADLKQITFALADALDLVGIDDLHHGKRVAFMSVKCGQILGWDKATISRLFFGGMLHDCGVSSTHQHHKLVTAMEQPEENHHSALGAKMLASFEPLAHLAPMVRYHHTHWDQLEGLDEKAKLETNLIFLTDRVDALHAMKAGEDQLMVRNGIMAELRSRQGTFFAPELLAALEQAAANEAFWLSQEPDVLTETLVRMLDLEKPVDLTLDQLRALAVMFADIVDAKSPFTAEHSRGVANLTIILADKMGLEPDNRNQMEIAALLHDLGKLRVPDEILDKPGPLDEQERARILRHSFDTYHILSQVDGFADIALWAGLHHESVDGVGYPFHIQGRNLPLEARIIAVADVFQALAQDRPYRGGLASQEILTLLQEMTAAGHLDKAVVNVVAHNLEECHRAVRD